MSRSLALPLLLGLWAGGCSGTVSEDGGLDEGNPKLRAPDSGSGVRRDGGVVEPPSPDQDAGMNAGCRVDDYAGCCYAELPSVTPVSMYAERGARLHGVKQGNGIYKLLPFQGSIYWTFLGEDDFFRVSEQGCHVERFEVNEGSDSSVLMVGGDQLFLRVRFSSSGQRGTRLYRIDPRSGDLSLIKETTPPRALGILTGDGGYVYWLEAELEDHRLRADTIQIFRMSADESSGVPHFVVPGDYRAIREMKVFEGVLYMALERRDERYEFIRVPTSTSAPQVLHVANGIDEASMGPPSAPAFYFFEDACERREAVCPEDTYEHRDCCGSRLQRLDAQTGALSVVTEVSRNVEYLDAPTITENFSYWSEAGSLRRAALTTGDVETLIEFPLSPERPVAQNGRLYWVHREYTGHVVPGPFGSMILSMALGMPW